MRRRVAQCRCLPWLCLLGLLGGGGVLADSDRQLKEAELGQLRERIGALQQEMNQVRNQHDRLQQQLRDSEQQINRIGRTIRELNVSRQLVEQRVEGLQTRQRALEQDLDAQQGHLARQVRAAYAMGRQETLKILLSQETPATVGRVMTYYDYLNRARSERIAVLNGTLTELRQVRSALNEELSRLRQLRDAQELERLALENTTRQRERLLARLEADLRDKDRHLGQMQRDERQLAELIRTLAEALDDIPGDIGARQAFTALRGQMRMPVQGPILASFGSTRNPGGLSWQGIRIGAGEGQEVRAISHGRVAFADWLRGYGLLMIIEHGDGYMSLYGNNQSLFKDVGDWVSGNEIIATVGDSGANSRGGLYFEIRKDGQPVDPIRWVRR